MSSVAADTHIIIWYFEDPTQFSNDAENALTGAVANQSDKIYVSAISIVEMQYLIEKRKIPQKVLDKFLAELDLPDSAFEIAPLDRAVGENLTKISRQIVPDMPDRIIAVTALNLNLPLVTADTKIQAGGIQTIW